VILPKINGENTLNKMLETCTEIHIANTCHWSGDTGGKVEEFFLESSRDLRLCVLWDFNV
jgi:hypothetical protein